jgi:ribosomal protein S15P/S13E
MIPSRCNVTTVNPEKLGERVYCFLDMDHTEEHRAEGGFRWPNEADERARRVQKLRNLFGVEISEDAGAPDVQLAMLGRMLESLEKHDQVQERTAKAFEAIAEHLGNVRILFDLKKPRVRRRRRRAKKGAPK